MSGIEIDNVSLMQWMLKFSEEWKVPILEFNTINGWQKPSYSIWNFATLNVKKKISTKIKEALLVVGCIMPNVNMLQLGLTKKTESIYL